MDFNTVPFSEAIGFVADLRDKEEIDYVYYARPSVVGTPGTGGRCTGFNNDNRKPRAVFSPDGDGGALRKGNHETLS